MMVCGLVRVRGMSLLALRRRAIVRQPEVQLIGVKSITIFRALTSISDEIQIVLHHGTVVGKRLLAERILTAPAQSIKGLQRESVH